MRRSLRGILQQVAQVQGKTDHLLLTNYINSIDNNLDGSTRSSREGGWGSWKLIPYFFSYNQVLPVSCIKALFSLSFHNEYVILAILYLKFVTRWDMIFNKTNTSAYATKFLYDFLIRYIDPVMLIFQVGWLVFLCFI